MTTVRRIAHARVAAFAAVLGGALALVALLPLPSSASPSLDQLNSALSQTQQQAQGLSTSVGNLSGMIGTLGSQIAFVEQRESAVRAELAQDRFALAQTTAALARERRQLALLAARLERARALLANQLVSNYEGDGPDLVSVILDSHGFSDLLDKIQYLRSAEAEQNQTIQVTRSAKRQADTAARRLAVLEADDRQITSAAATRVQALAGMNVLLQSKQVALQHARAAQAAALAAVQARGQALKGQIAQVEAQQAAAEQAAAAQPTLPGSSPVPFGGSGAGGSWVIPSSVVACESGGQNLTPNGAGASGYYQIIPSTWKQYGGSGSAAYLAPLSEQSAVASRIWAGGSGAGNWTCAGMLGIH
jgi:septal ring factor EnvC (AmiA/AmiB activator)